jgi:hypothetical protein
MISQISSSRSAARHPRRSVEHAGRTPAPVWTNAVTTSHLMSRVGARALLEIAARYDVRRISTEAMASMAKELLHRGIVNSKGYALLSFHSDIPDPNALGRPFQIGHPKKIGTGGHRNWIEEQEAQIEGWDRRPECASYVEHQKELAALLRCISSAHNAVSELDAA